MLSINKLNISFTRTLNKEMLISQLHCGTDRERDALDVKTPVRGLTESRQINICDVLGL